jgi:hypothetical protein
MHYHRACRGDKGRSRYSPKPWSRRRGELQHHFFCVAAAASVSATTPPFPNAKTPNCRSMYSSDYHRLKKLSSSITTTNKNRLTSEISQVQVSMKFPLRQEIDITRNDFQGNN